MTTLAISDLHLAADTPGIIAAFGRFVAGPARSARALYILGDLFDAWIGDDTLDDPANRYVIDQLAGLARDGVGIAFLHGNRDFLLGERFAGAIGAEAWPEETVIGCEGHRLLFLHGDQLCTDDVEYQRLRARIRTPQWRAGVLAASRAERERLAAGLRAASRAATAAKSHPLMDVNEEAVAAAFRRHGEVTMVHGHTHRPAHHVHRVDGATRIRWVLPDWHAGGGYLAISPEGIELRAVPGEGFPLDGQSS